jgi:hypothetical protein
MRPLRNALLVIWGAGSAAGYLYSAARGIPVGVAVPVLLAALAEVSLYAAAAFPEVRERAASLGWRLPPLLIASALVPYLAYSTATGVFGWSNALGIAALAAAVVYWFAALPRHAAADLGFLGLVAGVTLARIWPALYTAPAERIEIEILGQLMWIRLGVVAALLFRRVEGVGFGFWPGQREWRIGLKHYALFMPLGAALMYALGFAAFDPAEGWWWKAPATFLGILWVVALSEEFFFRGLLQQWLSEWIGPAAGLIGASMAFGAAHLPFRGFPNWRFALLAAAAGWFYGRAFREGGGIRAAMVTHALVAATWRTLFR